MRSPLRWVPCGFTVACLAAVLTASYLAAQELPPAYVESRRPWLSYGWSPLRAVRHGAWKLIAAPRPELYNLDRRRQEREARQRPRGSARPRPAAGAAAPSAREVRPAPSAAPAAAEPRRQ